MAYWTRFYFFHHTVGAETLTFDLTETEAAAWYVQDSYGRRIVLQPLYLHCYDCEGIPSDCIGHGQGSCGDAICTCEDGYFGMRCEFPVPCQSLSLDYRFVQHEAKPFEMLWDETGRLIEVYERPVYVHEWLPGQFDAVFFTGRRWALTHDDLLPEIEEELKDKNNSKAILATYFRAGFHAQFSNFSLAMMTEPLDRGTPRDQNSPIGMNWYLTENKTNKSNNDIQKTVHGAPFEFNLVCSFCDENNPCHYNGQCVDGFCECSPGSYGTLCEDAPGMFVWLSMGSHRKSPTLLSERSNLYFGHCDPYFKAPEFDWDHGTSVSNLDSISF